MRNFKKFAAVAALALTAGLLSGCADLFGGADEHDEALVGQWLWTEGGHSWFYWFDADGTGRRGDAEMQEFTWSTRGNDRLTLDFGRGIQNQTWSYSISGDRLEKEMGGEAGGDWTYFRVGHDAGVVGTWTWLGEQAAEAEFHYIFNADGSGEAGFLADGLFEIEWFTAGPNLVVSMSGQPGADLWSFEIVDDVLTIISRQVAGVQHSYARLN